jgi:hypothetical protein
MNLCLHINPGSVYILFYFIALIFLHTLSIHFKFLYTIYDIQCTELLYNALEVLVYNLYLCNFELLTSSMQVLGHIQPHFVHIFERTVTLENGHM